MTRTLFISLSGALALCCVSVLALSGCGGGDDTNGPDPPPAAQTLTASGWTKFTAGDLTGALADFDAAIASDATYGEAYVGQGWARLDLATTRFGLNTAVTSFNAAHTRGQTGPDVLAGRSAARLSAGGDSFATAAVDARAALATSPAFEFEHRTSFDFRDLHLMVAMAEAAQNNMTEALAAADAISVSGIIAGDSTSWSVAGTDYLSFDAAVLARLHQLAAEIAG